MRGRRHLFSLALAGLFSCPAHADLLCDASVKDAAPYQALYARLPARFRAQAVTLCVFQRVPGDELGGYWLDYPGVGPLIGLTKQRQPGIFAHEAGHLVHTQFSAEEWQAWVEFWRLNRHRMPAIGAARERPTEGFADAFGRWLRGKSLRKPVQAWFEERYADRGAD
jgi:hypothetical protein